MEVLKDGETDGPSGEEGVGDVAAAAAAISAAAAVAVEAPRESFDEVVVEEEASIGTAAKTAVGLSISELAAAAAAAFNGSSNIGATIEAVDASEKCLPDEAEGRKKDDDDGDAFD